MGIMTDLSLRLSANTADLKNGLATATQDLNNFAKDGQTAAAKITDSFKNLSAATSNIREMRTALRTLQGISFAGRAPEEIQAINQAIGNLTDEMGDLRAQQRGMGTDFGTILASGLQGVTAIGEVALGAASLFGVSKESAEKYQQAMVSLIGVSQGLATIQGMIEANTLGILAARTEELVVTTYQTVATWANTTSLAANTAATSAQAVMTSRASLATKAAAAMQWLWNTAILANPIIAIIAGVAALAAGIYYLVKAMSSNNEVIELQTKAYNNLSDAYKQKNDLDKLSVDYLKALGVEGKKALQLDLNKLETERKRIRSQRELLEGMQMTEDQLKDYIKLGEDEIKIGDQIIVKKGEIIKAGKDEADKAKEAAEKKKGAYELLTKSISDMEQNINNVLATGGVITPAMLDNLGRAKKSLNDINLEMEKVSKMTSLKLDPLVGKTKLPVISSLPKIKLETDLDMKGLDRSTNRIKGEIKEASDYIKADAKNLTKFKGTQLEREYNQLREERKKGKITETQYNNIVKELEKDKQVNTLGMMADTFGQAASLFEEHTVAFKALSISEALMNTYVSATLAYKAGLEAGGPLGLALGPAMAGVAVAAGLANVAKISGAFANGGIVPGSSYSGDRVLANVNSGEMILNGHQQAKLFSMVNNGSNNGRNSVVEFEIRGDRLFGVLQNYDKKRSRTR